MIEGKLGHIFGHQNDNAAYWQPLTLREPSIQALLHLLVAQWSCCLKDRHLPECMHACVGPRSAPRPQDLPSQPPDCNLDHVLNPLADFRFVSPSLATAHALSIKWIPLRNDNAILSPLKHSRRVCWPFQLAASHGRMVRHGHTRQMMIALGCCCADDEVNPTFFAKQEAHIKMVCFHGKGGNCGGVEKMDCSSHLCHPLYSVPTYSIVSATRLFVDKSAGRLCQSRCCCCCCCFFSCSDRDPDLGFVLASDETPRRTPPPPPPLNPSEQDAPDPAHCIAMAPREKQSNLPLKITPPSIFSLRGGWSNRVRSR